MKRNDLLYKWAEHLKTIPEAQFDMGVWIDSTSDTPPEPGCGTAACAAGWLPYFFRDKWKAISGVPFLRGRPDINTDRGIALWAGITYGQADKITSYTGARGNNVEDVYKKIMDVIDG